MSKSATGKICRAFVPDRASAFVNPVPLSTAAAAGGNGPGMDGKFLIVTAIACLIVAAAPVRAQAPAAGPAEPQASR